MVKNNFDRVAPTECVYGADLKEKHCSHMDQARADPFSERSQNNFGRASYFSLICRWSIDVMLTCGLRDQVTVASLYFTEL